MNVSQEMIASLVEDAGVAADISGIKGDTPLHDAGVDSLDMMNIVLAIEEKFAIKISDDDVPKLDTLDNIVRYLRGR